MEQPKYKKCLDGCSFPRSRCLANLIDGYKNILLKKKEAMLKKIDNSFSELSFNTLEGNAIYEIEKRKKRMIENQENIYRKALDELNDLYEHVAI